MKKKTSSAFVIIFVLVLALSVIFTGCGADLGPVSTDLDFENSIFKHINNGGITEDEVLPYNVDAITSATMTVEGPAVVTSIPLSVREIENASEGQVRGQYKDSSGVKTYEGLDLFYLLNDMVEGDNGIILTEKAYKVVLKNSNREEISGFTLEEITQAHDSQRPIILAYGVGTKDESTVAPFVFDGSDGDKHSLGYIKKLDNDDGCLRLVYDLEKYGTGSGKTFSNVAYVYVCEENEPGFKHTEAEGTLFDTTKYNDYIVTVRGDALGREIDMTVKDIENLVTYDKSGAVVSGGMGYKDTYSLANNAYWYVNTYEGVDLYKYLMYLGMQDAETMGLKNARTTLVRFIASDGVESSESFSVDTLSYPDGFGFYNKNAQDMGDGSYVSSNADLVKTGYPVLLSYGVNNYPYTISKSEDAYLSGLSNSGGPLRVVFGKTQYSHANGSNQVQYLSEILVGDDVKYNTHAFTTESLYNELGNREFSFTVNNTDGNTIINKKVSVEEIESLLYGEDASEQDRKAAKVKDHYEVKAEDAFESDIYEGIDMKYLLLEYLGLPGMNGTVTIEGDNGSITVSIDELFGEGYNTEKGRDGLKAILAFAKNGTPLVENSSSEGYVESVALKPFLDTDPADIEIDNAGGPLMAIIPSQSSTECDSKAITNVKSISIDLIPDSYAHINAPYSKYANTKVMIGGSGLNKTAAYTVSQIEAKQIDVKTVDFSIMNKAGNTLEQRYRGIALYDLFKEIGIKNNAGDVTVTCEDGTKQVYSLSLLKKKYKNTLSPDKEETFAMLAYGTGDVNGDKMEGTPLTPENGGPLMLIVPQEDETAANASMCLKNVTRIDVSANEVNTWSHSMSDVYSEFLTDTFTVTIKNDENEETYDYTVAEIEAMEGIILRDTYTVLDLGECEGIDVWKLVKEVAGGCDGIDNPVAVTAYANDGYKNDILSVVYLTGLENGVGAEGYDGKKVMLCYAIKGYPNVDDESHEGYTGLAKNTSGPLRMVVEGVQGASVKYCVKLVVTLPGSGKLNVDWAAAK